jgi:O-antigen/teichoic acid export membrane protein
LLWPPRRAVEAVLRQKLARDVVFLQASNTLQKAYGFLFSVAATRLLGLTGYGDFLLVLSLYTTLNLLGSLGLGQFLVVPLAQAAAARRRDEVVDAVGYNLKLSALLGALVLAVSLALGPWFAEVAMQRRDLGELVRIMALTGVPGVLYTICTTSLQSVRRMGTLAVVENVDMIFARALPLAAVLAGWGLSGVFAGMVAGAALSAAHATFQYQRVAVRREGFPGFGEVTQAAWHVPFRRYFRFSALAVADKNLAQFFGQTPLLFLGRFAGPEQASVQAAYFGIASKVFTLLNAFHGAASKAFSVRLSQEHGSRGAAATRRLFWRTTLMWGAISMAAAVAFTFTLPIFRAIYGPDKLPSVLLVVLFATLTAKQGFTVCLGSIFLIMDRVATNAIAKLPLLLIAIPAGALAIQRWGGSAGVAGYAVLAVAYQLGAFLAGDALYFAILLTPWFWRDRRDRR